MMVAAFFLVGLKAVRFEGESLIFNDVWKLSQPEFYDIISD